MEPTQNDRWAAAIHILRPDWPLTSLRSFATSRLADTPYRDALVMGVWIAADPRTETPARMLQPGPWRQATADPSDTATQHHPPVTKCPHGGYSLACDQCRTRAAHTATTGAALARQALRNRHEDQSHD